MYKDTDATWDLAMLPMLINIMKSGCIAAAVGLSTVRPDSYLALKVQF